MLPRVKQVVSQTRARIIKGITNSEGKIVSLFEHTTEIIRKGKPGKPTEFGKMIKVQEAENQIVVAYEVYDHAAYATIKACPKHLSLHWHSPVSCEPKRIP